MVSRLSTALSTALVLATPLLALPANVKTRAIDPTEAAIVFDGVAFEDPTNPGNTLATIQSYVFTRQVDFVIDAVKDAFEELGLDIVADKVDQVVERAKLFASNGEDGNDVDITVDGCSEKVTLSETAEGEDEGMVLRTVNLGQCDPAKTQLNATTKAILSESGRTFSGTLFKSAPDGFGVISDIDDTIKISNVLDKVQLVKNTFLEDPQPVAGMPELYSSLAQSLNSPQFIYISGSPFQLYPFLQGFVQDTFTASPGPILLKNLTLTDLGSLVDFIGGGDSTFDYKTEMIQRVQTQFPAKSFLAIGDSTEEDPEIYANAFKTLGADFIRCIWIHQVDGADNSQERFDKAFDGVPAEKIKVYTDDEIASLANIDVAGGVCQ